jgi:nitroimidazol reductase NimA-like FMN-containing flavoprotein (pyridoxamine 5'-phosphate oxidase superfamily)
MGKTNEIRGHINHLCSTQRLAVLCTHKGDQPYASLVAFVASDDLRFIYFATPISTRKYQNLAANPQVSMLINSSENQESDFHRAMAVTINGRASVIDRNESREQRKKYLTKHSYLEDFVNSPTCALVEIKVKSYFLVKNFQHVMELHIQE